MQSCIIIHRKITECTWEGNGLYDDNVKATVISKYYKVSISVYFASEGQMTQPLAVTVGQIVTERNLSLLFSDELDNDHKITCPR
jgi:hypothetical protein